MGDPILVASDVSVSFGGLVALRNVTFQVKTGDIFGIIGPNGAGKSTLLNVLSRFLKPAVGARIHFQGRDLLALSPHEIPRLGIGRTFQSIEVSPGGTVLENVLAGAALSYDSSAVWSFLGDLVDRRRTDELMSAAMGHLERLEIEDYALRPAEDVPYAVKKRLQLCRALMSSPTLLLLDEPASGMDQSEKALLLHCLKRLHRSSDLTIIVIEHDVGFLASMCDGMLALEFGKVLAAGSVADVTNAPAVIAAYLGTD